MTDNTCSNSCYRSLEERVFQFMDNSEIEVTPLQIAQNLHANRNTIRGILRQLLAKGKVVQPYHGAYQSFRIDGMRFAPLRLHNIILTVEGLEVASHWEWNEKIGECGLSVVFGTERGKATARISCDRGLDRNACLFAVKRCVEVIQYRLGHAVENVIVKTVEFNKDYSGVRLDGRQCLTVKGLYDVIERVYQKEENLVRHEFKVSTPMELRNFEGLLKGGLGQFNMTQAIFESLQEQRRYEKKVDFLCSHVENLTRILEAMYQRQVRDGI